MHPVYYSRRFRIWLGIQRVLALILLGLLLPMFATLYLAVRLTSRGPFLFRQERPGFKGRMFSIWKIRTMRVGSEKNVSNGLAVTKSHPCVTTIGRVLRDLKIDELPQLWNIVRGEMEFVGPRPIAPVLAQMLSDVIPGFEFRTSVRPGLTNLGQVTIFDNEAQDKVVDDWKIRFEAELHYLRNKSVTYDWIMMTLTVLFVVKKLTERVTRALRRFWTSVQAKTAPTKQLAKSNPL